MTSRELVEQAVFTSARSSQCDGYHLVATSPGISVADARELTVWGPTHDSLAEHCSAAGSVNFHPLPSGAYCVSRTTAAGAEYSDRGGLRIYTQCLLVPPSVLLRFANNPFRVVEAAVASGRMEPLDHVPDRLEPFRLVGRATPLDPLLLQWVTSQLRPRTVASLAQTAVHTNFLGIVGGQSPDRLVRALVSLLPPPCRREISLTTGLRFSTRRPFRLILIETDPGLQHRLAQRTDGRLVDLSGDGSIPIPEFRPWVQLLVRMLRAGQWDVLAQWYSDMDAATRPEDLDQLAARWRRSSRESAKPAAPPSRVTRATKAASQRPAAKTNATNSVRTRGRPYGRSAARQPARSPRQAAPDSRHKIRQSAGLLDLDRATLMENLDQLDRAVLDAIDGNDGALDRVKSLWPTILSRLPEPVVDESRQHYFRLAVRRWRQQNDEPTAARNPSRAVAALDVLATLLDQCDCERGRLP